MCAASCLAFYGSWQPVFPRLVKTLKEFQACGHVLFHKILSGIMHVLCIEFMRVRLSQRQN
jgi:hypothetical protein